MKTIFDEAATLACGGKRPMTVVAAEAVEYIGYLGGHSGMWGLLVHGAEVEPVDNDLCQWFLAKGEGR